MAITGVKGFRNSWESRARNDPWLRSPGSVPGAASHRAFYLPLDRARPGWLLRTLQAKEIDVYEARHAAAIHERLLDQSERERRTPALFRSLPRARSSRRRTWHREYRCPWAAPQICAIFAKASFAWRKFRTRIDQGDAAGHIGEDLFVKDYFAFDAAAGLRLTTVEFPGEPCADGGQNKQPGHEKGDFV